MSKLLEITPEQLEEYVEKTRQFYIGKKPEDLIGMNLEHLLVLADLLSPITTTQIVASSKLHNLTPDQKGKLISSITNAHSFFTVRQIEMLVTAGASGHEDFFTQLLSKFLFENALNAIFSDLKTYCEGGTIKGLSPSLIEWNEKLEKDLVQQTSIFIDLIRRSSNEDRSQIASELDKFVDEFLNTSSPETTDRIAWYSESSRSDMLIRIKFQLQILQQFFS